MFKVKYSLNGKGFIAKIVTLLLCLSVLFHVMGCWGFWNDQDESFIYMQILLPIVACILFAVMLMLWGEKHLALTIIPVLAGAAFFVVKATTMSLLPMVLCIVVSVIVTLVYMLTMLGAIETKWMLVPCIALPLLYQLIIRDGATLLAKENAMTMEEFIPELSVLCLLTALLLVALAMKKVKPADIVKTDEDAILGIEDAAEEKAAEEKKEEITLPDSEKEAPQEEEKHE